MIILTTLSLALARPSPHQEKLVPLPFHPSSKSGNYTSPDVTVYGYHPYWGGDPLDVDLSPLTHIAIFDVGMDSSGNINGTSYWNSVAGDLVTKAHSMGVKVHLCLTSFSDSVNNTVLPSASKRATAVSQLANLVNSYGADGVNVDIEGMDASQRNNLNLFTAELAAAVPEVFLATPAVDWSSAYDYATLASISDGLFIMGYDYHWSGGNPGPVDPLYGGSPWSQWSLDWTVQDYLSKGAPPDKIILGLPLYGRRWDTPNSNVPGTANGSSSSATFTNAIVEASQNGSLFDSVTRTPYVLYPYEQLWYGDIESVRERIRYANGQNLQGIGFWALSYENGIDGFWDMVNAETVIPGSGDDTGTTDTGELSDSGQTDDTATDTGIPDTSNPNQAPIANAGSDRSITVGQVLTLSGSQSSDPDGDPIQFSWRQLSGPAANIVDATTATPEVSFSEAGSAEFELSVYDGSQYATPDLMKITIIENSKEGTSCQSFPFWIPLWLSPLCLLRRRSKNPL